MKQITNDDCEIWYKKNYCLNKIQGKEKKVFICNQSHENHIHALITREELVFWSFNFLLEVAL